MGSIPLPALQVRAPEQPPNLIDQFSKGLSLQSLLGGQQTQQLQNQGLQQENQIRAQQLSDQQAITKSMQGWDGKDFEDLPGLVLKNGGSAQAVFGLKNQILKQKTDLTKLDTDTLANNAAKNDQLLGRLQAVTAGSDDGIGDRLTQAAQDAVRGGLLDPQHAQLVQQMVAKAPDAQTLRSQLSLFEKSLQGQKEQFSQAQTALENTAKQTDAAARQLTAQTGQQQFQAKIDPNSPLYDPSTAFLAKKAAAGDPEARSILQQQVQQAGAKAGAEAAARFPYETQLEQLRTQTAQTFQSNKDAADKIEGTVFKPYSEKMSQVTELQSAIQQAAQGNVTAARGVLLKLIGVTNPDGTKRYNEAEAQRLLQQGNISDRFSGTVKNLLTGNQWTDKMQSDMLDFANAQAGVAKQNLNSGIDNINRLYGTKVGAGLRQDPGPAAGTLGGAKPPEATHTAMGSDGKLHWTDETGTKDYGVKE